MKKLSSLTLYLFAVIVLQAQSDSTKPTQKQKTFNVSVRTMDNNMINGRLYAINDSQVVVLTKSFTGLHPVPAESIKSFSLKRKNSVLKGALIGFGTGVFAGIITGLASGGDPDNIILGMTAGEKAIVYGFVLGTGGAIIGTIIGALAKKKFIIGGKKETYRDLQGELMMRLVQK